MNDLLKYAQVPGVCGMCVSAVRNCVCANYVLLACPPTRMNITPTHTMQDPILRFGGMFAIGMAYRGTDNNGAIQKLLHFAVSDVSDDVRRAAVINLGFVLLGVPEQCPEIVRLLAESYNPHMRYGAALATGIACAGSGLASARKLLEPMLKDTTDFVRQGACIAMACVMLQQPEAEVSEFRKHLESTYTDKHEDNVCKMGAIMAAGILDAGACQ